MASSIYNHKHLQPTGAGTQGPSQAQHSHARLNDCFDTIRQEFDLLAQELTILRGQRDDLDNKVGGQVNELNIIRQSLYELETQHTKIRQQYEDEIRALRAEIHALRSQTQGPLGLASLGRDRPPDALRPPDPALARADPALARADPALARSDPALVRGDPALARGDPALARADPALTRLSGQPGAQEGMPLTPVGIGVATYDPFYREREPRDRERDGRERMVERDRMIVDRERERGLADRDRDRERIPVDRMMRDRADRERLERERDRVERDGREVKRIKTERSMKGDRGDPFSPSLPALPHPGQGPHPSQAHPQHQSISLGPALPPTPATAGPASVNGGGSTPKMPPNQGIGMGAAGMVSLPPPPYPGVQSQGARPGEGANLRGAEREREEGNAPFPQTPTLPPSAQAPSRADPQAQPQVQTQPPTPSAPQPPTPSASSAPPPPSQAQAPQSPQEMQVDLALDPHTVPAELKKEGTDWFAIFSPNVVGNGKEGGKKRALDVGLVHTLMHESVVCCVRFSADGKYLATGCNRTAQIYDTKTGQKTCVLVDEQASKTGDLYIRSVCFSPDGKLLATGAEDKQIRIWDIATKRIKTVFDGHQQEIYSLDFSRDGRLIVSGSGDKTARIWDMADGSTNKILSINEDTVDAGVTSVCISPDGRLVAAGSLDTIVRIWDVATGALVERLKGHRDSVYSVAFTPDGKALVSGSLDKTLKYWDLRPILRGREQGAIVPSRGSGQQKNGKDGGEKGSQCVMNFTGHKDYVLSVAVSHDGQWVVSGSKDRGVQFWDAKTATAHCMLQGHKNSVISIDLSPAGSILATGSGDWQARICAVHCISSVLSLTFSVV
ncbi:WD40 repeat-like protein [Wolfiporia cocos MD-104 SS10]|uniref:WD40 repeat-like protein n=1 Tax=Wolfiporia cocos (strain MD-104) TaxID=742152 RepID=A0A2H3JKZ6_WOLCO|nr:WD40 repeat-like protein [Wolfiporia cocos MD-104 SS10]